MTNVLEIDNINDKPSDFYQYAIKLIYDAIRLTKDDDLLKKLSKLNMLRKWLKQSIMTIAYNVTIQGISDKISETEYFEGKFISFDDALDLVKKGFLLMKDIDKTKITEKNPDRWIYIYKAKKSLLKNDGPVYFTSTELMTLSKLIYITVHNIIPPYRKLKDYFDHIIMIMSMINKDIFWNTPSGMSVSISDRKFTKKKIQNTIFKNKKPISILIPTEAIDYIKIKKGLMPNFIHSLDASNIHILIHYINKLDFKKHINLYTIHDCFASDYRTIALIELLVKKSFSDMYFTNNYLDLVHQNFISQIENEYDIIDEIDSEGKIKKYFNVEVEVKKKINKNKNNNTIEKTKKITKTILIPEVPNFSWHINKSKFENEIIYSLYFIH